MCAFYFIYCNDAVFSLKHIYKKKKILWKKKWKEMVKILFIFNRTHLFYYSGIGSGFFFFFSGAGTHIVLMRCMCLFVGRLIWCRRFRLFYYFFLNSHCYYVFFSYLDVPIHRWKILIWFIQCRSSNSCPIKWILLRWNNRQTIDAFSLWTIFGSDRQKRHLNFIVTFSCGFIHIEFHWKLRLIPYDKRKVHIWNPLKLKKHVFTIVEWSNKER